MVNFVMNGSVVLNSVTHLLIIPSKFTRYQDTDRRKCSQS